MRYGKALLFFCCALSYNIQGHDLQGHASFYVPVETQKNIDVLNETKAVSLLREACGESGNDLHLMPLPELQEVLHRAQHDILHMFDQMLSEGTYRIEMVSEQDTKDAMRYLVALSQDERLPRAIQKEQGRFVIVPHGREVAQHMRMLLLGMLLDILEKAEKENDHQ